ncbi:MAG: type II secretion system inner membrane protein GspF [Candidatus Thiodiazotropha sp. (ex. Lucinisca nassula)]|nr:type II secretion system inner membrane protein GspF [Candidatus Thiodiazotropha sp. (ex. Lucinisca nassula)]MBW9263264.1 type II secretion system inner membrane protein GspF [Candidatus Thiodiazotropha sp. (ex. Lucinisca nassula)]MBW9271087.1 type II secretion system inner membrane protein GspF [Candidatus Thiodiazotropha sp. (ex. Lucinisca nassula)]MCG7867394.1 type II secretion system inner membrane protein GspF [Candidatus Thiodiazotropha taylori]RLW65743.1 MAG: type II secretion system 
MDAFEYVALDPSGKEKRGVLEGDSPRQVRQQLRESGLTPLSIDSASGTATQSKGKLFQRQINAMELALITRQMATLLRSGLPLEHVLKTTAQQSDKRHVERTLLAVRAKVLEGRTLADGLKEFPKTFPEVYIQTVSSGEESGHLEVVLERLADYTEQRQQMRQKTIFALFYPALLTIVSLLIVGGLLTYIVPQVTRVFESMSAELPWITQALMSTSDTFRSYGVPIFVSLLVLGLFFSYLLKKPGPKRWWHRTLLRIPLVGRLVRTANAARFSRTLSIMAASSVPILDSMRIASQVLTNLPMRNAVEEATSRVREGASLYQALDKTGYFPPMTLSLLASGESSGNLEGMLERSADIQEREIETLVSTIQGLFEPILILVMGGIVLVIVLAILLPIFDLNQLVA